MSLADFERLTARDADCGCGKAAAEMEDATFEGGAALPTEEELTAALDAVESEAGDAFALELEGADQLLDAEEELAFSGVEQTDTPTLHAMLAMAERYPGLKITFSFGQ